MTKINIHNSKLLRRNLKLDKKGICFDENGIVPIIELNAEQTLYNLFKTTAVENMDKICIRHNNCELTYRELLKLIDNMASSLVKKGINDGDIVALPIKNCIEVAISLLAINKIGAISKWVDTDKSTQEFYDDLNNNKIKFLIADACIKEKIDSIKEKINVVEDNILYVNSDKFDKYSDFYKFTEAGAGLPIEPAKYDKSKVALIITSSGSTGMPKEILHSSFSVNSAVKKLTYTDYPIKDNIMSVVIPPYIGLGLVTTLYTSLICGGEAEIISNYTNPFVFVDYIKENEKRFENLKDNKKVLLFGAPMYFKAMSIQKDLFNDLSFIGAMMAAGSKIEESQLYEMDENLKSKGCLVPICNAYGQNEHCGGITYNTITSNKRGSAGKIAYGTRIMVVDPITREELPLNEVGKILEQSDSQFLGYNNNSQADLQSIFIDKDGEEWFDTKDLGCIDNEGFLHILDRESRAIIRFDNKVALAKIESKLLKNEIIEEAIVVKVNVPGPIGMDQAAFAFMIAKDENTKISYEELIKQNQESDYPLSMLEIPVWTEFISKRSVPYKNGKINYKKLEEIAQNLTDNIISYMNNDDKQKIKK